MGFDHPIMISNLKRGYNPFSVGDLPLNIEETLPCVMKTVLLGTRHPESKPLGSHTYFYHDLICAVSAALIGSDVNKPKTV